MGRVDLGVPGGAAAIRAPQGREGSPKSPQAHRPVEGVISPSVTAAPHPLGGDAELRALAAPWLQAQGVGRVLHEVGLEHGQARVDLLLLGPGVLHGLELKSERDSLRRLPAQVLAYSAALDFCTLAVAEQHLAQALPLVPAWWGVIAAVRRRQPHLVPVRQPAANPEPSPLSCARLLWRDEVLAELRRAGVRGPIRGPGEYLRHKLVALVPAGDLRDRVRAALLAREEWR